MFEVRSHSPFDDDWQSRDEAIRSAAGIKDCWAGAGFGGRDHGWRVETFEDAKTLKARLETVPLVTVTIREETTEMGGPMP